ncbi:MAG: DUF3791 domain-containing protein [Treponema sp.]|jgi:hypothetical protein|nr:DUF3791 domain-containing protein [Treponema sp.]
MTANKMLLQRKYARVISAYANLKNISLREAMEVFYNSEIYKEMRNGISYMHCRSDGYLAEEMLSNV